MAKLHDKFEDAPRVKIRRRPYTLEDLAREVGVACDRFFRSRNMPVTRSMRDTIAVAMAAGKRTRDEKAAEGECARKKVQVSA